MKEIISLRKEREKHYLCEDGTFKAFCYKDDIHYLDNGVYKEIDNTLIKHDNYYINKNNDFKVSFADCKDNNLIYKINLKDHYLDVYLFQNKLDNSSIDILDNSIHYINILDGIDFSYELIGKKLKETIILNKGINSEIAFLIKTNLTLFKEKNIIYVSDGEKVIYKFEPPFMYNINGNIDIKIEYELLKYNDCYKISLKFDNKSLDNVTFPVYIDPTISTQNSEVYDTYIYPGDTSVNRNNHDYLKIGIDSNNIIYRALVKYELPTIGTGSQVINAKAYFTSHLNDWRYTYGDLVQEKILAHEITSSWSETTANWNSMNDKYNSFIETYAEFLRTERVVENNSFVNIVKTNELDITNLVKKWYSGKDNNGIMLKFLNETYNSDCPEYYVYSKNNTASSILGRDPKPYLVIWYRNQNGIVDYMSYNNLDLRDSIGKINLYNGNFTYLFALNETIGGLLPASLNYIYNTNDANLNSFSKGWRFDLCEKLRTFTAEGGNNYIEWLDSTSNLSYFYEASQGVFKDESGQNMEIESINSTYILKDKYGNKRFFTCINNEYLLTKIENELGNEVILTYDNSNRLIKVKDANNEEINITYNSSNIIVSSAITTTTINYLNGFVDNIVTKNGTTTFMYNSNGLIQRIEESYCKTIELEYYDCAPYRIKKVKEIGENNSIGNIFTYNYDFNVTTMVDRNGLKNTYSFNNQGNNIGRTIIDSDNILSDSYGFNQEYASLEGDNRNNKNISNTIPQKYVANLLYNTSFEKNDTTIFSNGTKSSDYARTGLYSYKGTHVVGIIDKYEDLADVDFGSLTFSAYIKNSDTATISIYERTTLHDILIETITMTPNNEFTRFDFTTNGIVDGGAIVIVIDSNNYFYIDDYQLEEGCVSNSYNMIDNSQNHFDDWNLSTECEIVNISNFEEAIKINSNPDSYEGISYPFSFGGLSGDVYRLSFWYKNNGVLYDAIEILGNQVNIQFFPVDDEMGTGTWNIPLNYHCNEWQFFSELFVADYDYSSFNINIMSSLEANNILLTDFMLVKEKDQYVFEYDTEGNLILVKDLDDSCNIMKYDKNNQLIGFFTPSGKHFKYEYDNVKKSLLLRGISPTGISNEIIYDENDNPIKTLIRNLDISENLIDGKNYSIRLKSSNKYFDIENNNILSINENVCNVKVFKLIKSGNYYKIKYSNKFISLNNNQICLSSIDDDSVLFSITSLDNGSYMIITKSTNKSISFENNSIVLKNTNNDDPTQQFYFEGENLSKIIENSAEYTEDGKYITKITDSLGKSVRYKYDLNGNKISEINAKDIVTNYSYTSKDQLSEITNNGKSIRYLYNNNGSLSKIQSGQKEFEFEYDEFGNLVEVSLNNNTLIRHNYLENNGNLETTTYGNQNIINYTYDKFNRISSVSDSNNTYTNIYNNAGNIAKVLSSNEEYNYAYNSNNKITQIKRKKDNDIFNVNYVYDNNCVSNKQYYLDYYENNNNTVYLIPQLNYHYDQNSYLDRIIFDNNNINYSYDGLGRIISKNINDNINVEFDYYNRGDKTAYIIKSIKIDNDTYEYKYDDLYNVTDIKHNGFITNHYVYNDKNELIKDDNYITNISYRYSYDNEGNLLAKKEYELNTDILLHYDKLQYNNSNWEDQLTSFNNQTISYDSLGNPLSIGNNSMTWTHGRKLNSYSNNEVNITYNYDKDGIRNKKIVNGQPTYYYYEDKNLIIERTGENVLYFLRDEKENLIGFKYNNQMYYYIKNAFDDIIGIKDSMYNTIAYYNYDAWGNILSITDNNNEIISSSSSIAIINPFRYRSYYYDKETGFYYLNNRYYNPKWGRFINIDSYILKGQTIIDANMYLYCNNNPINSMDHSGDFFQPLVDAFKEICSAASELYRQSAPLYAGLAGATLADGPLPVADVIAGAAALALAGTTAIYASYVGIKNYSSSRSISKTQETTSSKSKAKEKKKEDKEITIYRWHCDGGSNIVPTDNDLASGTCLSFSTAYRPNSCKTTIEKVNKTRILYAFPDNEFGHVSVCPVGVNRNEEIQRWHDAGLLSPYSQALRSVITWDGE